MEDWWGWIIVGAFWVLVIGGSVVNENLDRWRHEKRKRTAPSRQDSIELEKLCPTCDRPLQGRWLKEEDYDPGKPFAAWRVCFECGFEEQALVEKPWTREHGNEVRTKERRDAERLMIAKFKQNRHLRTVSTLEGLTSVSPIEFEHAVAEILRFHGYRDVFVRGGAGDLAVDIECLRPNGEKVAIQCKQYSSSPVGSKEMQTFIGMIHQHHGINAGMYVTTSRYTKPAVDLARRHNIELIDRTALVKLAAALHPVDSEEEEQIRSLEMWDVVAKEERDEVARKMREAELERRRRGRQWARMNRGY